MIDVGYPNEYGHLGPNFVPKDILPDVIPQSYSQGSQMRSRMDLVHD